MDSNTPTIEDYSPQELTEIMKSGAQTLLDKIAQLAALLAEREARIKELENEVETLKNDPWTTRLTYDNVVEQIASYEDPSQRDEARKLIEPLLKREQVRQLRKDVKRKVKELEEEEEETMVTEMPKPAAENFTMPACLLTPEAERLWEKAREAGFIEPDGYMLAEGVSANQAAYLADHMAIILGITREKWKIFQHLWSIKNMAQLAGSWQQTGKLPPKAKDIDAII